MIPFQNDSPTMTQAHTGARETEREREGEKKCILQNNPNKVVCKMVGK